MPTPVILPKQGQSVESCLIVEWKKSPGDAVAAGDILCEIETDKAVMEIESPAAGTLLATFFAAGDVAPVQVTIAAIGAPGEDAEHLRPAEATSPTQDETIDEPAGDILAASSPSPAPIAPAPGPSAYTAFPVRSVTASPRARRLADRHGIDIRQLTGSGPGGRIIERDIPIPGEPSKTRAAPVVSAQSAATARDATQAETERSAARLSPVAKAMVDEGSYAVPPHGSGPRGRVMARDLQPVTEETPKSQAEPELAPVTGPEPAEPATVRPLRGVRKRIAQRMRESLQATAQLTLNRTADARALQSLRAIFKAADPASGLQVISINDLILYAVAQTLRAFPALNARFEDETVSEFATVHLGFAVDTPRGLLVPVIRHAESLGLHGMAQATKRLGAACVDGSVGPDDLTGGTFTVTNLGSLGIESFTPILNPPQVAILGVGAIALKPVARASGSGAGGPDAGIEFIPHLHLSLTIDHQAVDGAPGARFLQALADALATLDQELIRIAASPASSPPPATRPGNET